MKKYSIIGILVAVVFAFTALSGVFADNSKSGDNKKSSKTDKLNAKNVKIHPRISLKGADAEKFKKNKELDEILMTKGQPYKSTCGSAAATYEFATTEFAGDFCTKGEVVIVTDPLLFPLSPDVSVYWDCLYKGITTHCEASMIAEEIQIPLSECGLAATTYESAVELNLDDLCATSSVIETPPLSLSLSPGDKVDWTCVLGNETPVDCSADVKEAEIAPTISATGVLGMNPSTNKHAIVIGICDYPDFLEYSDICESDGDAANMARALHMEYDFPIANIHLFRDIIENSVSTGGENVISYSASKTNIIKAIDDLRLQVKKEKEAGTDSEVVFFFSGHGVTGNIDGDNELLDEALLVHNGFENINKNKGDGQFEKIWDDELKAEFADFETDRITFIFDTCKAGGMNDVMEGFSEEDSERVFVASSSEEGSSYVYSDGEEGEGLFSHYFVKNGMRGYIGVGGGWADGYNEIGWDYRTEDGYASPVIGQDGLVAIEEAYEYAKDKLGFLSVEQIPTLKDFFVNDLLLGYWADYSLF